MFSIPTATNSESSGRSKSDNESQRSFNQLPSGAPIIKGFHLLGNRRGYLPSILGFFFSPNQVPSASVILARGLIVLIRTVHPVP